MSSINLQFDRPWVFIALIPVLALILFPFLRLPKVRRNTFKRIAPVVMHSIIATILIILLAGTTIVTTSYEQQVMILLDMSDSTADVQDAIKDKADELKCLLEEKATVGMMAFANNSLYEIGMNSSKELQLKKLDTEATDISAALNAAANAMSDDKSSRIIILSDGKQTKNDASATAYLLNNNGVRIDAMYFNSTNPDDPEMQISSVVSSDGGYVGDAITITVEIESNTKAAARLKLYDNDKECSSVDLLVNEGTNVATLQVISSSAGTHTFYIELEPSVDTIEKNNSAYAYASVAGKASLLIICDRLAECADLSALLEESCEVTTVTSKNAPTTIIELCNYDEVILLNVDNKYLPKGFSALADTYVKDYGRSLLTVGGKGTLMYGNMEGTEFAELLPVDMELTESGEGNSVAIMLIIDSSSSMTGSTGGWGAQTTGKNYMTLAKQGAIKCIETLSDADYAGVISFNSNATVEKSLTRTTEDNKAILSRTISSISTGRGTQYNRALQLAYEELKNCDADVKYVMFLSDGSPQDSGYLSTASKMAEAGITVSTIGIGGTYSALSQLAAYGNGRYYAVTNASDLPDIMLSETEQVTVSSYITGSFSVVSGATNSITDNIDEASIPILTGYLGTTLKEDATAVLTTESGHPIYARWQYGSGISAVFTSDLSGGWSEEWFTSEIGRYIIEQIIASIIDSSHHDSSMNVTYTRYGDIVKVSVTTTGEGDAGTVNFSVSGVNSTGAVTSTLSLTGTGAYEGSFELDGAGVYETIAIWNDAEGNLKDFTTSAYAASYSEEYNAFVTSGKSMLEAIVSYSGGSVTNDTAYLCSIVPAGVSSITDPFILLSIIAMVLFLADVAIRKIRWRDISNNFRNIMSSVTPDTSAK